MAIRAVPLKLRVSALVQKTINPVAGPPRLVDSFKRNDQGSYSRFPSGQSEASLLPNKNCINEYSRESITSLSALIASFTFISRSFSVAEPDIHLFAHCY